MIKVFHLCLNSDQSIKNRREKSPLYLPLPLEKPSLEGRIRLDFAG